MKTYIYLLFCYLPFILEAQQQNKEHRFLITNETKVFFYNRRDPRTFNITYAYSLLNRPTIGYFINDRHAIGLFIQFDRKRSNLGLVNDEHAIGLIYKHYFRNPFDWDIVPKKRWRLFSDFSYAYGNYLYKNGIALSSNKLKYHTLNVGAGFAFRLYKDFHLGAVYRGEYQINGTSFFTKRLSMTYHFPNKPYSKTKDYFIFKNWIKPKAEGSNKIGFADKIVFGTNAFYFFSDNRNVVKDKYWYQEVLWNKNIGISLDNHWLVGINHFNIWGNAGYKGQPKTSVNFNMVGTFLQYNFGIPEAKKVTGKNELFFEGSLHYGDRCTCGSWDFYKRPGLFYWGLGVGFNFKLPRNFDIELGFHNYQIFNKVPQKYNSTQFVIGLNYNWFRKK